MHKHPTHKHLTHKQSLKHKIKERISKSYMIPSVIIFIALGLIGYSFISDIKEGVNMKETIVVLETSVGDIEIKLFDKESPISTENFLSYVEEGFYDNTVFHRVIDNFMIQGGGFNSNGTQKKTRAPIKNEADNGVQNKKYTIAMARTNVVNSATSQFFINLADNSFLDHGSRDFGYAVFGEVIKGTEIVEKIGNVETITKNGMQDWPRQDVFIKKAYVKK